jgi:hypothetical protein
MLQIGQDRQWRGGVLGRGLCYRGEFARGRTSASGSAVRAWGVLCGGREAWELGDLGVGCGRVGGSGGVGGV